mgnify:CR=1 FL=1
MHASSGFDRALMHYAGDRDQPAAGAVFIADILGGIYALIVAASLGQIASAYPTAGSLYHWSSILGGKFWGWLTAYTNLLGLLDRKSVV